MNFTEFRRIIIGDKIGSLFTSGEKDRKLGNS